VSWFSKIARNWGQIPFSLDDLLDRPYSNKVRGQPYKSKKTNMIEDSPGLSTTTYNKNQPSAEGYHPEQIDSITSGHQIEHDLYGGQIMDESPAGGRVRPRTSDRGGQDAPGVTEGPQVLGTPDDIGAFLAVNYPGDKTPAEVARNNSTRNFLNFQKKKPSRQANLNGQIVNVY